MPTFKRGCGSMTECGNSQPTWRRSFRASSDRKAPLNRFLWGAEIGQKQIDADVQEGMRFHDRMWEFATNLEKEFPGVFRSESSAKQVPVGRRNRPKADRCRRSRGDAVP